MVEQRRAMVHLRRRRVNTLVDHGASLAPVRCPPVHCDCPPHNPGRSAFFRGPARAEVPCPAPPAAVKMRESAHPVCAEAPMTAPSPGDVTRLLAEIQAGSAGAKDRLVELVYEELRRLASGLARGDAAGSLPPTALVHEAFLRLEA